MTSFRSMNLVAATAMVLALSACKSNGSEPASASDTPAATPASSGGTTSTGAAGGTTSGGTGTTTGSTTGSSTSGSTAGGTGATGSTGGTGSTAGGSGNSGVSGSGVPALVNVNLENILNNLSVELNVNRNNIPVTAQVPIAVAASVCGVSVDVLAASVASGQGSCTATTSSAQLSQAVQQQIASGGSVTGGDQNIGSPPTTNQ